MFRLVALQCRPGLFAFRSRGDRPFVLAAPQIIRVVIGARFACRDAKVVERGPEPMQ
jgi:hypothetical protein